jgi:hypothetical protein
MFTQYYNESIRKLVIAFGSLFNNIKIAKKDSGGSVLENIRVPLAYGPKEKFIQRINMASSISDTTKVQISLPRLGFDITSISYDPTRRGNKLRKRHVKLDNGLLCNYAEVPYNISFGLYSFTRTMDENLQIMESILPNFSPEFIVSLNINDINKKVDVPITLNRVNTAVDYEGDFSERRYIISTYDFTSKSYVYNKQSSTGIILKTTIDIFGSSEKFYADVGSQQDLRITATGAYQGASGDQGFTYGNFIYGPITYEP